MFRISKNDDPIERPDPENEATGEALSADGSGSAIAAPALRWLRGQKKLEERIDESTDPSDTTAAVDRPETSPTHATGDLDALVENGQDSERDTQSESRPTPTDTIAAKIANWRDATPFDLYDTDDDIGDFDDLSPIDGVTQPEPVAKIPSLPSIDLDDIASPDDLDSTHSLPIDLGEVDAQPGRLGATTPALDEQADSDEPAAIDEPADYSPIELETIETAKDEPIEDKPSEAELKANRLEEHALTLDETPIQTHETSLALQPIPELQTAPRAPIKATSAPTGLAELDDGLPAAFDDDVDDVVDTDLTDTSEDPLAHDDVDLDADLLPTDDPDITASSIEELAIEPPYMASSDDTDDQIGNDWHAHLADVLGGENDLDDRDHAEIKIAERSAQEPARDTQATERDDDALATPPLSKTLARLVNESDCEAGKDILISPLLARSPRQKTAAGQPPSALPADTTDLAPEQLSLGIIANVPRLRRFAAVQIGDELLADQLVQTTIETVLADPSALQPASDLGLELITLLYQRRQEMLDDPTPPQRSPDAAHAFETALCRGLAGADQFEIHQFARAINRLDERERELLVLVALENFTYDQIADMIQIPTERVMTKVANARISLRQLLASDESGPRDDSPIDDASHAQEIEIHGYLDGELDGRHMADVDALVERDQDAADRLLHYGIQGDLIRRLYAPLLNRPIPSKMLGALSVAAKPARWGFRFGSKRALIAGAFMLALGASAALSYVSPAFDGVISDAMAISLATIQR